MMKFHLFAAAAALAVSSFEAGATAQETGE
jgi:hypothetical protein